MSLATYLKKQSVVTGPLSLRVNNSTLSVIKYFLFGYLPTSFDPRYQLFGREFHKRSLEQQKRKKKLTPDEEKRLKVMVRNLLANPVFKKYYDAKREHLIDTESITGIPVQGTLDVNNQKFKVGCDPKTTSCKSREDFIKSCLEYGYPRQDWVYCQIAKLDYFIFFGVQKFPPHSIFVVSFHDKQFKEEYHYFKQEAIFLLYFFKHYGIPGYMKGLTKKKR